LESCARMSVITMLTGGIKPLSQKQLKEIDVLMNNKQHRK
jgi:hypothetical protein